MKKIVLIMIVATILLVGCQATPEKDVVVNKNTGNLEAKIDAGYEGKQNILSSEVEIGENGSGEKVAEINSGTTWQETMDISASAQINVDAAVSVPAVEKYPVYRVKAVSFTPEQVGKAIETLTEGKPVYQYNGGAEPIKEECENDIVRLRKMKSDIETNGEKDLGLMDVERALAAIEKAYAESVPLSEWISTRQAIPYNELRSFNTDVLFQTSNNKMGRITIYDDAQQPETGYECSLRYTRQQYEYDTKTSIDDIGISITPDEAKRLAENIIADMGVDYMAITDILVAYTTENGDQKYEDASAKAYSIYFRRVLDGISTPYIRSNAWKDNGITEGTPEEYRKMWQSEYINLQIDDDGLAYLAWYNPIDIVEKESENVEVVDFEQAKELFKTNMTNILATKSVEVEIDDIELGYVFVPVKDVMTEYMLVPSWIFFGKETLITDDESVVKNQDALYYPCAELIINGVDRSVI